MAGVFVTGETVAGVYVTGATVVGAFVIGATVVGAFVTGATVVGALVTGAPVVGGRTVGDDVWPSTSKVKEWHNEKFRNGIINIEVIKNNKKGRLIYSLFLKYM